MSAAPEPGPAGPVPARDPRTDPRRVAALPSVGRITGIGFAAVLVPGIAVYIVCKVAGLSTGAAGLWGLLAMFLGLGWYPTYLRRLGKRLDAQMAAAGGGEADGSDRAGDTDTDTDGSGSAAPQTAPSGLLDGPGPGSGPHAGSGVVPGAGPATAPPARPVRNDRW